MSSQPPQPPQPNHQASTTTTTKIQTYLDKVAHRLHGSTSKSSLPLICAAGFLAEALWHSQVETRVLRTPPKLVYSAMRRAVVFWPALFLGTSTALWWAEGRVGTGLRGREQEQDDEGRGRGW